MKCEKCGVQDVSVFLRKTTDGETREYRLCMDCAREMGMKVPELPLASEPRSGFRKTGDDRESSKSMTLNPVSVDESLNYRRKRNALREKMAQAVRVEDYLEAARLRDELRSMDDGKK